MKVDQQAGREREKAEEIEKDMLVCFGSPLPFTNFYFQHLGRSGLK